MKQERRLELEASGKSLTKAELALGFHFCPDWDFAVVGPFDPENEACLCNINAKEEKAISVIDEAANIYWEQIKHLPKVVKRLSMSDIRDIFDKAVKPAIDEVRQLDRAERQ